MNIWQAGLCAIGLLFFIVFILVMVDWRIRKQDNEHYGGDDNEGFEDNPNCKCPKL